MGLGQRPILLLQLGEQPHVFNGDDRLIGECLEQRDLVLGKRPRLDTCDGKTTENHVIATQRHHQPTSMPSRPRHATREIIYIGIFSVGYMAN